MVTVRSSIICFAAAGVLLAGCASSAGDNHAVAGFTPVGSSTSHPTAITSAVPVPTFAPCVYPSPADIAKLASESTMVIRATLTGGTPAATPQPAFPLTNVKVLARSPAVANATPPAELVSYWPLKSGDYVLFVGGNANTSPTEGLLGEFRVSDGKLLRQCQTLTNWATPTAAAGTPPAVTTFIAAIPLVLPTAPPIG